MVHHFTRRATLLSGLSFVASCSLVYGDTLDKHQCDVDADCASDAATGLSCVEHVCQGPTGGAHACQLDTDCGADERCGFDNQCYSKWGCVDAPADWPVSAPSFHVKTLLRKIDEFVEADSLAKVGEVDAVVCVTSDLTCSSPIVRSEQTTLDANKLLDVPFSNVGSAGFNGGIIKITPKVAGAYLPVFLHATGATPWVGDYVTQRETPLANISASDVLQSLVAGKTIDPAGAIAYFQVYDCGGRAAAGVAVSTDDSDALFFPLGEGNFPVTTQTATTSTGVGVMLNLTAGKAQTFTLKDEVSMKVISTTVSLLVRGGGSNVVNFYPRYSAVQAWMAQYNKTTH